MKIPWKRQPLYRIMCCCLLNMCYEKNGKKNEENWKKNETRKRKNNLKKIREKSAGNPKNGRKMQTRKKGREKIWKIEKKI